MVQPSSLQSQGEVTRDRSAGGKKASVLIIDDSPADVGLVREAIDEHCIKCTVKVIHDGQKAIRFLEEMDDGSSSCPDLVILDLNLPRISGFRVLERLRASPKCSHVAIAILTSSDDRTDRAQAAMLGATQYLIKPVALDHFLRLGSVFKQILAELGKV